MASPIPAVGNQEVAAEIVTALTSKNNQTNPLFGRAISNMHSKPPENRDIKLEALSVSELEKSMAQQHYSSEWFSRFKKAEAVLNKNSETQIETESKDEEFLSDSSSYLFERIRITPLNKAPFFKESRLRCGKGEVWEKRLGLIESEVRPHILELCNEVLAEKAKAVRNLEPNSNIEASLLPTPVDAELKEPTVAISPPVISIEKQNPAKRKFVCSAMVLVALSVAGLAAYIHAQNSL
jgi:hypothetical protein